MDIRKIKKLIDLIQESDVAEIEISEGEESVRISRASSAYPQQQYFAAPQPAPAAPSTPSFASEAATTATAAAATKSSNEANAVRSPMVGTFYGSPHPMRLLL